MCFLSHFLFAETLVGNEGRQTSGGILGQKAVPSTASKKEGLHWCNVLLHFGTSGILQTNAKTVLSAVERGF